jgi:hypothetical protein
MAEETRCGFQLVNSLETKLPNLRIRFQNKRTVRVDYLEWTNYLKDSETSIGIRSFAYYLMLYQILHRQYVHSDGGISTLIPLAPHISWFNLFEQILVLDATATICDYMYRDYTIFQPGHWNFGDIELGLKYLSGLGNLFHHRTYFFSK